jgi:hypothetical protein
VINSLEAFNLAIGLLINFGEISSKSRSTINEHILNIYEEKELDTEQSMRKIGNSDFYDVSCPI